MEEITLMCIMAVIMTGVYARSARPKLYAFFNITAGAVSLAASEIFFTGSLTGINFYNTALSVILGVPGVMLHRLIAMM